MTDWKIIQFTCPNCGGHRLEQVIMVRNIIEVHENLDPECDWDEDWDEDSDEDAAPGEWGYTIERKDENNFYRCEQCDTPLSDEEGNAFWGIHLLVEWLRANCKQEESI